MKQKAKLGFLGTAAMVLSGCFNQTVTPEDLATRIMRHPLANKEESSGQTTYTINQFPFTTYLANQGTGAPGKHASFTDANNDGKPNGRDKVRFAIDLNGPPVYFEQGMGPYGERSAYSSNIFLRAEGITGDEHNVARETMDTILDLEERAYSEMKKGDN